MRKRRSSRHSSGRRTTASSGSIHACQAASSSTLSTSSTLQRTTFRPQRRQTADAWLSPATRAKSACLMPLARTQKLPCQLWARPSSAWMYLQMDATLLRRHRRTFSSSTPRSGRVGTLGSQDVGRIRTTAWNFAVLTTRYPQSIAASLQTPSPNPYVSSSRPSTLTTSEAASASRQRSASLAMLLACAILALS
jgi:hypothetical protein